MSTTFFPNVDTLPPGGLPGGLRTRTNQSESAGLQAFQSVEQLWRVVPRWGYLLAGAMILPLASLKWNVAPLAWIVPVPYLLYLKAHSGTAWYRVMLLLSLLVGANLMTLKFLTAPVPWMLVPAYGVPIALVLWLVYIGWNTIRVRVGDRWGLYLFPAIYALAEVAAYRLTEVGVWGAAANTQLDDLRLLQLASLVGMSGIGFLMTWFGSAAVHFVASTNRRRLRLDMAVVIAAVVSVYAYGSLRIHAEQQGDTVTVAGIVADLGPTPAGLPGAEAVALNTDVLFERSAVAAARGARLIVWNEAATVVQVADESTFVQRGVEFALGHKVDLVLAYIVPLSATPFSMDSKFDSM